MYLLVAEICVILIARYPVKVASTVRQVILLIGSLCSGDYRAKNVLSVFPCAQFNTNKVPHRCHLKSFHLNLYSYNGTTDDTNLNAFEVDSKINESVTYCRTDASSVRLSSYARHDDFNIDSSSININHFNFTLIIKP